MRKGLVTSLGVIAAVAVVMAIQDPRIWAALGIVLGGSLIQGIAVGVVFAVGVAAVAWIHGATLVKWLRGLFRPDNRRIGAMVAATLRNPKNERVIRLMQQPDGNQKKSSAFIIDEERIREVDQAIELAERDAAIHRRLWRGLAKFFRSAADAVRRHPAIASVLLVIIGVSLIVDGIDYGPTRWRDARLSLSPLKIGFGAGFLYCAWLAMRRDR